MAKTAGIAALLVAALILAEAVLFVIRPQPGTVQEWFVLLSEQPVQGAIAFWALELPMYAAFVLVFAALAFLLRRSPGTVGRGNPAWGGPTIAALFALVGAAVFYAGNNPSAIMALSKSFAEATTSVEQAALVAAGRAVLAQTGQRAVGAFNIGLLFVTVAGIMVSVAMVKSPLFSRATAIIGILAHGLSLADYLRQLVTDSPLVALAVIMPGAILIVVWFVMVGVQMLGRRRSAGAEAATGARAAD